jgi:hypothetical protein
MGPGVDVPQRWTKPRPYITVKGMIPMPATKATDSAADPGKAGKAGKGK